MSANGLGSKAPEICKTDFFATKDGAGSAFEKFIQNLGPKLSNKNCVGKKKLMSTNNIINYTSKNNPR